MMTRLAVKATQRIFSGTVREAFLSQERTIDFHGAKRGSVKIALFKIARRYSAGYPFCLSSDLGPRAFRIDRRWQGRGFGTEVARRLPVYLAPLYPEARAVW